MIYRIQRDAFAGYEVLFKRWWFPFWTNDGCNTFTSYEAAERFAQNRGVLGSGKVR